MEAKRNSPDQTDSFSWTQHHPQLLLSILIKYRPLQLAAARDPPLPPRLGRPSHRRHLQSPTPSSYLPRLSPFHHRRGSRGEYLRLQVSSPANVLSLVVVDKPRGSLRTLPSPHFRTRRGRRRIPGAGNAAKPDGSLDRGGSMSVGAGQDSTRRGTSSFSNFDASTRRSTVSPSHHHLLQPLSLSLRLRLYPHLQLNQPLPRTRSFSN